MGSGAGGGDGNGASDGGGLGDGGVGMGGNLSGDGDGTSMVIWVYFIRLKFALMLPTGPLRWAQFLCSHPPKPG